MIVEKTLKRCEVKNEKEIGEERMNIGNGSGY